MDTAATLLSVLSGDVVYGAAVLAFFESQNDVSRYVVAEVTIEVRISSLKLVALLFYSMSCQEMIESGEMTTMPHWLGQGTQTGITALGFKIYLEGIITIAVLC